MAEFKWDNDVLDDEEESSTDDSDLDLEEEDDDLPDSHGELDY